MKTFAAILFISCAFMALPNLIQSVVVISGPMRPTTILYGNFRDPLPPHPGPFGARYARYAGNSDTPNPLTASNDLTDQTFTTTAIWVGSTLNFAANAQQAAQGAATDIGASVTSATNNKRK